MLQNQVARDLQKEIAEEEYPSRPAVNRITETKLLLHLQRRKANVDPVHVGDDVEQK